MPSIEIRVVSLDVVIPIRMRELDPPRSWNDAISVGDTQADSVHFAAFDGDEIVGVSSVGPESIPLTDAPAIRFRGLSVVRARRGNGFGTLLFRAQHDYARQLNSPAWFYAKTRLSRLYLREGFIRTSYSTVHPNGGPVNLFVNPQGLEVFSSEFSSVEPGMTG